MKITITIDTDDRDNDNYLKTLKKQLDTATTKLADAMDASLKSKVSSHNTEESTSMANPVIQKLIDQVNKTQGVMESATTFIAGFKQRLDDAVAAAIANGATEEELAPIQAEIDELDAQTVALSEAVANNP